MTDSYHFESVPKFRVGGIYRQEDGRVVQLFAPILAVCTAEGVAHVRDACGARLGQGHRFLDSGREWDQSMLEHNRDLIPGELVQRDGQWVAADAPIVFPSGAAVLTSGDKIVGRVEASPATYDVSVGKSLLTAEELNSAIRAVLDSFRAQDTIPEPIRPALDWNTATPFDTFGADFIVTKGEVPTAPLHTSPTTDSAYPAIAGLLRG